VQLHDEIRKIASSKFVLPAHQAHRGEFSIAVKALMKEAQNEGVSTAQRTPAFCTAIQTKEFLDDNELELVRVEGPASKKSTTVVVWFRFRNGIRGIYSASRPGSPEDPLLELSGVLRGAIREGAAAFLRELRRDDSVLSAREAGQNA